MTKMMKRITAALLALCCTPMTALPASADDLHWFGNATWDAFEEMELIGQGAHGTSGMVEIYLPEGDFDTVYLVTPRETAVHFTLRDEVDIDDAGLQIAEILEAYFPGIQEIYDPEFHCTVGKYGDPGFGLNSASRTGIFSLYALPENSAEIESAILLNLARRHLISEFYGFGETADYWQACDAAYGMRYYPEAQEREVDGQLTEVPTDWEGVQRYLDAHHPGLTVEKTPFTKYVDGVPVASEHFSYSIGGTDSLTVHEKARVACELWAEFDLEPMLTMLTEDSNEPLYGHNALESPGDVTLDCELSLLDAVALNKNLLGVEKLPDTAVKNADVNGDGTPDSADSLAILRELVGLTDGFAEK